MKKNLLIISIFLLIGAITACTGFKKMDRPALVSLMERYLTALAKHDPSSVPLARNVKLVENTEVTPIGKGLWETATGGPTDFNIFVADPVAGQVAFMGVIMENDKPTILGTRLKVVKGKITEIDHLVIHSGDQLSTGVMSYITDINRRRFIAVDEEMGLVFAFSMFVHNGEPRVMKITGVPGIIKRPNKYGQFDLPAAHVFKIRNGKIYEIEAIGYVTKHGTKNGWE